MTKLDEIKAAINALSKEEFAKIRRWLLETSPEEIDVALAASLERGHRDAKAKRGRFVEE